MKNITFVLLILFSLTSFAQEKKLSMNSLIEQGQHAFKKRQNPTEAKKAFDFFKKAIELYPKSSLPRWSFAMASYFVGHRVEQEKEKKIEIFTNGYEQAKKGISLDPKCAECYFWGAINYALFAETDGGIFTILKMVRLSKDWALRSIKINPKVGYAGAYRLLSLIEHKTPGVFGGSDQLAKDYLEKAIQLAPDEPLNYLFLGRLYLNGYDDKTHARLVLKKGSQIKIKDKSRIESVEAIEEMKELLKKEAKN
tara:strand:- start:536 stop:1294 length:759 start_codon:yes stop_codon:yes gene_type:complete